MVQVGQFTALDPLRTVATAIGRRRAVLIPAGELVAEMLLVDRGLTEESAYAAIHAAFGSQDVSLHPAPKPAERGNQEITLHARTGVMLTEKGRERARALSIPLR